MEATKVTRTYVSDDRLLDFWARKLAVRRNKASTSRAEVVRWLLRTAALIEETPEPGQVIIVQDDGEITVA